MSEGQDEAQDVHEDDLILQTVHRIQASMANAQSAYQETVTRSHLAFLKAAGEAIAVLARPDTRAPGTLPALDTRAGADSGATRALARVRRQVVVSAPSEEPCQPIEGLDPARPIFIVPDDRGIASFLAENLRSMGYRARVGHEVPAEPAGVIFLTGISALAGGDAAGAALALQRSAFAFARRVAPDLRRHGGLFVTVQDTDGDFNLAGGAGSRSWTGGLAALAKTAGKEWPRVTVKAIDIQCRHQSPEEIALSLLRELTQGGSEPEVALRPGGHRARPSLRDLPLDTSNRSVPDGTVILASGGGRGIVAECLHALARRSRLRIALIGTTSLDVASGSPRAGEVRATIGKLERCGAEVLYFDGDVRDAGFIAAAAAEVRDNWGSIGMLLHGAGVNIDQLLHQKSDEVFENVLTTKILGLRNLLAATTLDPLTHLCCFSSIAARYGNPGQGDYAMANEILNKVCQSEARARAGRCRVKSLNWGPWDGGMVTDHHRRLFELAGLRPIAPELGGQLFVREIEDPDHVGPVEVLLHDAP